MEAPFHHQTTHTMMIEALEPNVSARQKPVTGKQYVFSFEEGDPSNKQLLGGKGANLCAMTRMGLNVPPGFVISTEACLAYLSHEDSVLPEDLLAQVKANITRIEAATGKKFGDAVNPLLVSVRSGSALSMPGMMDTILNLGLSSATIPGLIRQTSNERFVYDAYRRLIQLFGKVALGVSDHLFDEVLTEAQKNAGVKSETGLNAGQLKDVSEQFLAIIRRETGNPFPEDAFGQLEIAIRAVFKSWMGRRAVDYRKEFRITPQMANGTAVNVVTMVFGNMGNDSATGVGFTRDPGTGENVMFGEYLVNAQGEDVVAGIRTPKPVAEMAAEMPVLYEQLQELRRKLELNFREVQDFEYTIEKGVLYCLQTRNGKMNAAALVRTSVEMAEEELITRKEALRRIKPEMLEQLLHPTIDPSQKAKSITTGLPASPGAATGKIVFDADRAVSLHEAGEQVILVREETRPEDIHGFFAARGVLTSRGGKTSHAAVVARGMGKPCVAGAGALRIDNNSRQAFIGDVSLREGDALTIDGSTGEVYLGVLPMKEPTFSEHLGKVLSWADEVAELRVFANTDTPVDARKALSYGAMGIGLCRTERMFNAVDRLPVVVDMILAETEEDRTKALDVLHAMQKKDFIELFTVMAPRPVTVRLLDPPIHEFLPTEEKLTAEIQWLKELHQLVRGVNTLYAEPSLGGSAQPGVPFTPDGDVRVQESLRKKQRMLAKTRELREVNPMLGHRGVRLGITQPGIYDMQIAAILEAAAECRKNGVEAHPEIMVPQVAMPSELQRVKEHALKVAGDLEQRLGVKLVWKFGTMIEVVRACLEADELAGIGDFFSFGTNDLTQAAFSFSREDAENKFLPDYLKAGIMENNPFEVLDLKGVGKLMKLAVAAGRQTNPALTIGICGEHGGQPQAIAFCHQLGLNYVSCSAPRVPVARMAAAHAVIG